MIYLKKNNISLSNIIEMSEKTDDDYCEEFKKRLKSLNINALVVMVISRQESMICIKENEEIKLLPVIIIYALNDLCKGKDKEIREIWYNICIDYNLELCNFYDEKIQINLLSFEITAFCHYSSIIKSEIKQFLNNKLNNKLLYIFSSSLPGINIVYRKKDYYKNNIDEIKNDLNNKINEIIVNKLNILTNMNIKINTVVNFYHPNMDGYNSLGIYRED